MSLRERVNNMAQLGFYFDQTRCIGCRTCQISCKDRNDLTVGVLYRRVASFDTGEGPTFGTYNYASTCNHCFTPACVANCPTGSMHKDLDDGTVQRNALLCIGCDACIIACPYSVPVMLEDKGIVGKCDSCKPFRDDGQNPVCVDACVMRALDFGDLADLEGKYGSGLVNELPILPSAQTTEPSVRIKPRSFALNPTFKETLM